ncbi:MAG: single-stranded DNA binding protein [Halobacteriales archaeon]
MGAIEDIYADVDADVSEEEFRDAVEEKVEQMGGLADEETAAMLIAHELAEGEVESVAEIEPGMEEVKFLAKVVSVGDVREFERDDAEEPGRVVNVELADETGAIRGAFWDDMAEAATEELEEGQVLRVKGRPREGYNGIEVSVDDAEPDEDAEIEVDLSDEHRIEDLSMGLSDVTVRGQVLDVDDRVRTFDRDDGSEGRVANLVLGDETGRIRVTLWDERTALIEEFEPGESVEVIDGYVREREGDLELHVGDRGTIERIEEEVTYVPESTDIAEIEIDRTVDIAGVVRSADPKRTFDRDDGSEGQVKNIRVQDDTGDIRVALWGDMADREVAPGDEVQVTDVEIQDGWQDELEASANWQSTLTVLEEGATATADDAGGTDPGGGSTSDGGRFDETGSDGGGFDETGSDGAGGSASGSGDSGTVGLDAFDDGESPSVGSENGAEDGETVEFTGVVVQEGEPVVLDDGEETVSVATEESLELGQEVTVRGRREGSRVYADEVV